MTPAEYRAHKDAWGMSHSEMCAFLGVTGTTSARYAAGTRKVDGATERLIKLVAASGLHPWQACRAIASYTPPEAMERT